MTADELMQFSVEKAIRELNWESIEYLFRPVTVFALLCRFDLDGMEDKVTEWFVDMSPDAMPHRFRREPLAEMNRVIQREKFYRRLKAEPEKKEQI